MNGKTKRILAVVVNNAIVQMACSQLLQLRKKSLKIPAYWDSNPDLCDTGAVL